MGTEFGVHSAVKYFCLKNRVAAAESMRKIDLKLLHLNSASLTGYWRVWVKGTATEKSRI